MKYAGCLGSQAALNTMKDTQLKLILNGVDGWAQNPHPKAPQAFLGSRPSRAFPGPSIIKKAHVER